ncbi:unnamed protein product [Cylindrotheca closterium]|uniref:PDEase domain-containing protein n=1 Tax=Cylindrotheca closterium TaxID=2856 RepID=A0AAD2GCV0_9STRA|nr:unnamed protein product [Cylindrotheca closterium]
MEEHVISGANLPFVSEFMEIMDDSAISGESQLLVNVVMATDIADKELGALRKARWNVAFDKTENEMLSSDLDRNRKATIVIEHLIQASDVSHTMQHWQVYIKWNEKFFF